MNIRQGLLLAVVLAIGIVGGTFLSGCANLSASSVTKPATTSTIAPATQQSSLLGTKQNGALSVQLFSTPNPPVGGYDTIQALVSLNGQPVSDAKVSFDVDMTNMNMGKKIITAISSGKGLYSSQLLFSMLGPWRLIVNVERAGQTNSVRFDFYVNSR